MTDKICRHGTTRIAAKAAALRSSSKLLRCNGRARSPLMRGPAPMRDSDAGFSAAFHRWRLSGGAVPGPLTIFHAFLRGSLSRFFPGVKRRFWRGHGTPTRTPIRCVGPCVRPPFVLRLPSFVIAIRRLVRQSKPSSTVSVCLPCRSRGGGPLAVVGFLRP